MLHLLHLLKYGKGVVGERTGRESLVKDLGIAWEGWEDGGWLVELTGRTGRTGMIGVGKGKESLAFVCFPLPFESESVVGRWK